MKPKRKINSSDRGKTESEGSAEADVEKRCNCADNGKDSCDCASYPCKYCPCDNFSQDEAEDLAQCPCCFIWYHVKCVGLLGLNENDIRKMDNWLCYMCWADQSPIAMPLLAKQQDTEVSSENEEGVEDEEITMADLRREIRAVKKAVVHAPSPKIVQEVIVPHIEAAVSAAIDTKMGGDNKKTWADLLRENNSNRDKDMVDKIEKVVKTNTTDMIQKTDNKISSDQYERERRSRNIVIRNVPESPSNVNDVRTAYDTDFLVRICAMPKQDIKTVYRAGKRSDGKNRPMIVVLPTREAVSSWTNDGAGYKITAGEEEYWINKDLTLSEQLAGFRARQAKQKMKSNVNDQEAPVTQTVT